MKTLAELREFVAEKTAKNPKRIVVAAAQDAEVLTTIKMVNEAKMGSALLVGDKDGIAKAAKEAGLDLNINEVLHEPDTKAAADLAVQKLREGEGDVLMKGLLQSPVFMKAILNSKTGIKSGGLVHLVTALESPSFPKVIFGTDLGMVAAPTFDEHIEMIRNSAAILNKIGVERPKVAIVGAAETVSDKIPWSIESATLAKMGERGQLGNVIVDGPLSFDLACFPEVAKHKGVKSEVAGDADIIVLPDVTAGNILYKSLIHVGKIASGTVFVGTKYPVVMSSRSDSSETKLNSVALTLLMAH